ncbi:hypothetical protein K435DRAFT_785848 [Dendrothele bispora CBS 962.96]|uniref:Uncharacterized protein n=1 Tax=Dendrothele bispora (strain CBS 962.96) TaxID=1314807 RepID=A0A4S8KUG2_DENBC|nr:hypothetical protein K435DRAFT_785848 [Dendrothele bispora CBS 962.96]
MVLNLVLPVPSQPLITEQKTARGVSDPSPQGTPSPPQGRGNKVGDFSQFTNGVSRKLQLKSVVHEEFMKVSQMDDTLLLRWLTAHVLSVEQRLDILQPADAAITLPQNLLSAIDEFSGKIFLSPNLGAYKERPNDRLIKMLKKRPDLLPLGLKENKQAMKVVKTKVDVRFTQLRNSAKKPIHASLGKYDMIREESVGPFTPVIKLTQELIESVGGRGCEVTTTLPLVARVAFLRLTYTDKNLLGSDHKAGPSYWDTVDKNLKEIRDDKQNEPKKISQVFTRILQDDREKYRNSNVVDDSLDGLAEVAETNDWDE